MRDQEIQVHISVTVQNSVSFLEIPRHLHSRDVKNSSLICAPQVALQKTGQFKGTAGWITRVIIKTILREAGISEGRILFDCL